MKLQACAVAVSRCRIKLLMFKPKKKFIWKCISHSPIIPAYTWSAANHLILLLFFLSCFLLSFQILLHFLLLITFFLPTDASSLFPAIFFCLPHNYSTAFLQKSREGLICSFWEHDFSFCKWWLAESRFLMYLEPDHAE